MKSITVTENELKELMETGFFVRVEPVKKGEFLGLDKNLYFFGKGKGIERMHNRKIKTKVGEEYSVKNEKGKKQWWCSNCNSLFKDAEGTGCWTCKFPIKPLLVRLDKIEFKIIWKKKKDGPKDCWLKTFRRVEK